MNLFLALCFLSIVTVAAPKAGECFSRINSKGKCEGLLYQNLSVAECCSRGKYYTRKSNSYKNLFLDLIRPTEHGIRGVSNCYSCKAWLKGLKKESCATKVCRHGKVCRQTRNTVKCVCKQRNCTSKIFKPVCSNKNITYASECSLRDTACRKNKDEWVEYDGVCTDSCANVRCRNEKHCIQDQSKRLHCVHCARFCAKPKNARRMVCGLNGVTYLSNCHLRNATCQLGKTIGIAYTGQCKVGANCSTIICTAGKKCIMHDKKPHCIDCGSACRKDMNVASATRRHQYHTRFFGDHVCGSNGLTYPNRCALQRHMCATGTYISVKYHRKCRGSKPPFPLKPMLTAAHINKLKYESIKVRQLLKMIRDLGLNVTLHHPSRLKGKRVAVYPIICRIIKIITGAKLGGCP